MRKFLVVLVIVLMSVMLLGCVTIPTFPKRKGDFTLKPKTSPIKTFLAPPSNNLPIRTVPADGEIPKCITN